MKKNKRYAKNPLLYIHQPNVGTPRASMQSNYQSTKGNDQLSSSSKREAEKIAKARPQRRHGGKPLPDETRAEMTTSEFAESSDSKKEKQNSQSDTKKFKDMTLLEKVKYFADEPNHIPRIKCEIKTADKSYRGKIMDFDGETVFMRVGNRVHLRKVPFGEIQRIRMLGF